MKLVLHWNRSEQRLNELETRIALIEQEQKVTQGIRNARNSRREFWTVKMVPSISGLVVAVLGMNAVFHWF